MTIRTAIDLFSGLGGFTQAAETNGIEVLCHVEIDKDCGEYLQRRWPGIPLYTDINTFPSHHYAGADLVMGGPPCQPVSCAGKRAGSEDDRWLWPQTLKVVEAVRPRWCLFENPPGIRNMGLDGILSALEDLNYTVGTVNIPACAANAPHIRQRYWIVAHNPVSGRKGQRREGEDGTPELREGCMDDTRSQKPHRLPRGERSQIPTHGRATQAWDNYVWTPCADGKVRRAPASSVLLDDGTGLSIIETLAQKGWPKRSILKALGNSIVPQVASTILKAMSQADPYP